MPVEQPMLSELMAVYLRRLAEHPHGLVSGVGHEVEPYDAVPTQALDPAQTWNEAIVGLASYGVEAPSAPPPVWPSVLSNAESSAAVPMAAAQFPQAVRDLARLARFAETDKQTPPSSPPSSIDGLDSWLRETESHATASMLCLAAGILRHARRFDDATRLINAARKLAGRENESVIANEEAATLWMQGKQAEADKIWNSLPDSTPVMFNCGMSALFSGNRSAARTALSAAIEQLDDSSGWRHLARLYLALAQS